MSLTQGLQGFQGVRGIGLQGSQGAQGPLGIQGLKGVGLQGIQGNQGTQGRQGDRGNLGSQGIQGLQGARTGLQGIQGSQGPTGNTGPIFMSSIPIDTALPSGFNTVIFSSVSVNTDNYYNASTGIFTPLVPGYYIVFAFLEVRTYQFRGRPGQLENADLREYTLYKNDTKIITNRNYDKPINSLVYLNGINDYLHIVSLALPNPYTVLSGSLRVNKESYFQAVWVHG